MSSGIYGPVNQAVVGLAGKFDQIRREKKQELMNIYQSMRDEAKAKQEQENIEWGRTNLTAAQEAELSRVPEVVKYTTETPTGNAILGAETTKAMPGIEGAAKVETEKQLSPIRIAEENEIAKIKTREAIAEKLGVLPAEIEYLQKKTGIELEADLAKESFVSELRIKERGIATDQEHAKRMTEMGYDRETQSMLLDKKNAFEIKLTKMLYEQNLPMDKAKIDQIYAVVKNSGQEYINMLIEGQKTRAEIDVLRGKASSGDVTGYEGMTIK